jgi:hypothetical protein
MSSPVREILTAFVAGRATRDELVRAVRAAHYQASGPTGPAWQALVETIERSVPGTLELVATSERPGFVVQPLQGPVDLDEASLREAVRRALDAWTNPVPSTGPPPVARPDAPAPREGLLLRLVRRVRNFFRGGA